MKRLLNLLVRTLWLRLRPHALIVVSPAPEEKPEWDAEDQAQLLHFLRSDTGRKLLVTLRCNEEIQKANACEQEVTRVDHARGRAVGYREAIASLIVLSAPLPPNEEDTADSPDRGADELRKNLSH